MRARAFSVKLNPELEEQCLGDLSYLCTEMTKPGEELKCLQEHMEKITPACKKAVTDLIQVCLFPLSLSINAQFRQSLSCSWF